MLHNVYDIKYIPTIFILYVHLGIVTSPEKLIFWSKTNFMRIFSANSPLFMSRVVGINFRGTLLRHAKLRYASRYFKNRHNY